MSPTLHSLLLLLHLLAAIVWVGGMFFAHFCLRPAALEKLDPPLRLPLMEATFRRFFTWVSAAVAILLATGLTLLLRVGFAAAPAGWHAMLALGLAMTLVFAWIRGVLYPRLRAHCAAGTWPLAGQVVNAIRRLVELNLVLGTAAVAAAVWAR